jgi:hypothetical protein
MAENTPENMETENAEPFPTVFVLQAIKNAQQKHGLRHQNYQRYRTYCSAKIRRVRTVLKFTHHHKCTPKYKNPKFQLRPITDDMIDNVRYFEILIFEVERAWAYAMQLKYEENEDEQEKSRKKFHKMNKLRRALEHALHLEQIAKSHPRVDSTTKLEVQAYCAYIGATLGVEAKHWKTAEELYKKVITIYQKLLQVVDSEEMGALYEARCKEVQPVLTLCTRFVNENVDESETKKIKVDYEQIQGLNLEFDDLNIGIKDKSTKKDEAMEIDTTTQITELPRLEPMPCKPVFFDLALNHIKMPSLNSRIRELSEKEKPPAKPQQKQQQTSKKQAAAALQKSAPKKEAAQTSKGAASKKNEKAQVQEPEEEQQEQAGIGSKIKNLFWGFK